MRVPFQRKLGRGSWSPCDLDVGRAEGLLRLGVNKYQKGQVPLLLLPLTLPRRICISEKQRQPHKTLSSLPGPSQRPGGNNEVPKLQSCCCFLRTAGPATRPHPKTSCPAGGAAPERKTFPVTLRAHIYSGNQC